jgi:D-beta-D-heptose 7-phosphate kinase/D-beta-D-heptose 1-phosphate adenosyltransferase
MESEFRQLSRFIAQFPGVRVLCVGDIMVDRYVYGQVSRVSAEAPIPVMSHKGERVMLGAVGNVARNVVALGGKARIVAIVGDDAGAREVERLTAEEDSLEADFVTVPGRRTTLKTRYVAGGQQLLRADQEDTFPLEPQFEERLIGVIRAAVLEADAVAISDYAKGCLPDAVLTATIRSAREAGKPVIVDPKSADFTRYDGVSLIKPNAGELCQATGIDCTDDDSAIASARAALDRTMIESILVTRSDQGMTLVEREGEARHFKEKRSEVFDVSGAGDTALAMISLALGAGASVHEAATLANKACNLVVSKIGTAVVYAAELMQSIQSAEFETAGSKITPLVALIDKVVRWRAQGLTVGLTNGCFDLVHAGHVSLLMQSKATCDRLIVGLNSDSSVRGLKGEGRPINSETARAIVLASFSVVDAVVVFSEETPMRLIDVLRPDVLIKGADYTEDRVVGAEFVKSYGGKICLAELAPELSTTNTIRKIKG